MSVVVNEVRRGFYLDSVGLMRMSRELAAYDGVEEAALMMATPANKEIMANSGVLAAEGGNAGPGDLVIAVRAFDAETAGRALKAATGLLSAPKGTSSTGSNWQPKSIAAAMNSSPESNLALISVPGTHAISEARKALRSGLHVMIFSDNVPLQQEVDLKREARRAGLLAMGPDCGTAIIGGVPLAFANLVPHGPIGIIGASGTGVQEVSSLIARFGGGISHAIGTGGRDLYEEVGGITTLMAIDLFDGDAATETVILISKPPARPIVEKILKRVAQSPKHFVICFLGTGNLDLPSNAVLAPTLKQAAQAAMAIDCQAQEMPNPVAAAGPLVRGLFCGGTLCAEAQLVFQQAGEAVTSNAPVPGADDLAKNCHQLVDLGADEYTAGRPHPMIEPGIRDEALGDALADSGVGVLLLDLVLGHGAHADPAGFIVKVLEDVGARKPVIASVTGTHDDPQGFGRQVEMLKRAGVLVAPSNEDAAALALACLRLHN